MRRFLLSIVLLAFAAIPALCQSRWEALKELRAGQKIVVVETTMQHRKGKFVSASEEALTLRVGRQQVSINRDKVARVSSQGHRVRNAVLLAVTCAVVGAAIGHTRDTSTYTGDGPGAVVGGIAGGVGGALIPTGKTYYRLEKLPPQTAGR
jgi:uncharacterized protein YcfJ